MHDTQDPLGRLFGETITINRDRLANVLAERVWLDRESRSVHFKHAVRDELGKTKTVITALLAQRALALTVDGATRSCEVTRFRWETRT